MAIKDNISRTAFPPSPRSEGSRPPHPAAPRQAYLPNRGLTARALILLLGCCPVTSALALEIKASLERDGMRMGESVHLILITEGQAARGPDLSPLNQDFRIIDRSSSRQVSVVNGQRHERQELRLTLTPLRAGQLEIPAIAFGEASTQPLRIEVAEGPTAQTTAATAGESAPPLSQTTPSPWPQVAPTPSFPPQYGPPWPYAEMPPPGPGPGPEPWSAPLSGITGKEPGKPPASPPPSMAEAYPPAALPYWLGAQPPTSPPISAWAPSPDGWGPGATSPAPGSPGPASAPLPSATSMTAPSAVTATPGTSRAKPLPPLENSPPPEPAPWWPWALLGLGLGALGGWVWRRWRHRRSGQALPLPGPGAATPQETPTAVTPPPLDPVAAAIAEVRRAYESGEALAARDALLAWATLVIPDQPPSNLAQLATRCPEPLREEILLLEQAFFSPEQLNWESQPAWEGLAGFKPLPAAGPASFRQKKPLRRRPNTTTPA